MFNGSKILALDVDDVLVNITFPWCERLKHRPNLFNALDGKLSSDRGQLMSDVVNRKQPHIQQWLQENHNLDKDLLHEVDLVYRSNPVFYDDLEPTKLCRAIQMALDLPGRINEICVITHNFNNNDPCVESKDRWLRKYFSAAGDKLHIHHVESPEKKSSIMEKYCPEPDVFADDSLKNIIDVLLNDKVRPHEILIPKMGHNEVSPDMYALAALRKIKINHYTDIL
jgi:hypothetical protein